MPCYAQALEQSCHVDTVLLRTLPCHAAVSHPMCLVPMPSPWKHYITMNLFLRKCLFWHVHAMSTTHPCHVMCEARNSHALSPGSTTLQWACSGTFMPCQPHTHAMLCARPGTVTSCRHSAPLYSPMPCGCLYIAVDHAQGRPLPPFLLRQ